MAKRILNEEPIITIKVGPPKQDDKYPIVTSLKVRWCRVAVCKNEDGMIYTRVIDTKAHEKTEEAFPNFLFWLDPQEYMA